jgi:transposase
MSDVRSYTPHEREALRIAVVAVMATGRYTLTEVANLFGTSTVSIHKWVKQAEEFGAEGLVEHKRGRKPKVA